MRVVLFALSYLAPCLPAAGCICLCSVARSLLARALAERVGREGCLLELLAGSLAAHSPRTAYFIVDVQPRATYNQCTCALQFSQCTWAPSCSGLSILCLHSGQDKNTRLSSGPERTPCTDVLFKKRVKVAFEELEEGFVVPGVIIGTRKARLKICVTFSIRKVPLRTNSMRGNSSCLTVSVLNIETINKGVS